MSDPGLDLIEAIRTGLPPGVEKRPAPSRRSSWRSGIRWSRRWLATFGRVMDRSDRPIHLPLEHS
jgi:hypothetical protein